MRRQRVSSSVIAGIGWDARTRVLEVKFHSGRVYYYFDVPAGEYEALKNADSPGNYFNEQIKPKYRVVRLPAKSVTSGPFGPPKWIAS